MMTIAEEVERRDPYRLPARVSIAVLLVALALLGLGIATGGSLQVWLLVLGGGGTLIAALSVFLVRYMARSAEQQRAAFAAGDALVRWKLAPGPWNHYARAMRANGQLGGVLIGGILGLPGVGNGLIIWSEGGARGLQIVMASVVLALCFGLLFRWMFSCMWRTSTRPVELIYTPRAALLGEAVITWQTNEMALTGAELDVDAARVVIEGRITKGRMQTPFVHRLPYPSTEAAAAARVVAQIKAGCGLSGS